jgi:hypothetical protein
MPALDVGRFLRTNVWDYAASFCALTMVADITKAETDSTKNDVLFSLSILWPISSTLFFI